MATLKDILKNISTVVNSSNANVQPIIDSIENFITTQESNVEQQKADKIKKISSELLQLYNTIKDFPNKFCSFLKCLKALLPILGPDIIISDWWNSVLIHVLHSPLQPKDIVEQVKGLVKDVLTCETDKVKEFRKEILELYLKESSSVGIAAGGDDGTVGEQTHAFWCRNLDSLLREFGAVETKEFFILLNSYFVQSTYRLQVLTLFGEFIRKQNLHIHQILETPLLDSLLTSLQRDTSTTLISLSLTTLIMLLPHICISVTTYLPGLYIIFSRIICWDKHISRPVDFPDEIVESDDDDDDDDDDQKTSEKLNVVDWNRCDSTFDNAPSSPPSCKQLFTFLYGMFPCNTVKFLKDPSGWIKEMNNSLLRIHTLHPNLIMSDSEKELSDTSRWMKLEPADVVAECVSYDMENASSNSNNSNELENLTKIVLEEADTKIIEKKTQKARRPSQAISIHEIMDVHQALKSGADIVVGDDPWASRIISYSNFLTVNHPTSPPENESPPTTNTTNTQASVAYLQREIMLLRNELNFELYLKQQHLQHIGRLHRDHILDSTVEAERQNLYNTCKILKSQLSQTQAAFDRQKTETANTKKKHVQWENELNNKLKQYKNEKKEWKSVLDKLEQELSESKLVIDAQNKQIEVLSAKCFSLENQIKLHEPQLQKLTEYEHTIDQLTKQLMEADTIKFQEQKRLMETLVGNWHKMEMMLKSGEHEIQQLSSTITSQSLVIDDLKIQLENSTKNIERPEKALEKQMMMWSFERDKRDKEFKKLETQFDEVKKHNEELQSRIIELLAKIESLTPPNIPKIENKISEELSEKVSKEVNEEVSEEVNEKVSGEVSEELSEKASEEVSEEVIEKVSEKVNEELIEKVSEEVSEEASEKVSEEVSEEASEKVNEEVSKKVSEKVSEEVSGLSGEASEEVSEEASEKVDEVSGEASEKVDEVSGEASEKVDEVSGEASEKVDEVSGEASGEVSEKVNEK
ncbi:hypothetical protein RhiirC2_782450 [Rhizophagus irregularis]|uniref:Hamartin n=1 Tax=Rhizophagus irregularis TaxID=588596 RepID=A0A2N1N338_9GLOM|nr:hypothetical protein RhiirC2_782450 [Rhizophagus irregularis]